MLILTVHCTERLSMHQPGTQKLEPNTSSLMLQWTRKTIRNNIGELTTRMCPPQTVARHKPPVSRTSLNTGLRAVDADREPTLIHTSRDPAISDTSRSSCFPLRGHLDLGNLSPSCPFMSMFSFHPVPADLVRASTVPTRRSTAGSLETHFHGGSYSPVAAPAETGLSRNG